jgi:hypothetical protein
MAVLKTGSSVFVFGQVPNDAMTALSARDHGDVLLNDGGWRRSCQRWKRLQARHFSGVGWTPSNKRLVLTMPARRSFSIIARYKRFVVTLALFCRSGRWHGRTSEALALFRHITYFCSNISVPHSRKSRVHA